MRNILLLGFVSFFADISSEMVYPILPLYLVSIFGATPALVGIIEGIAESLASLLKVFSGYATDRYKRKKALAMAGYSTAALYKLALVLSTSWVGVLAARIIDRFGKGIRTSPRDVLVAENAAPGGLGKAFGLHKAMDMAGSAVGILLAYFLVRYLPGAHTYRSVFWISAIPAVIALFVLGLVRENRELHKAKARPPLWSSFRGMDRQLKFFLVIAFLFTLGNSSNAFLLLRAQNVGYDPTSVILLYFLYNAVVSLLSMPFGKLSDRVGRKRLLILGYVLFSLVYFGFAAASGKPVVIALFAVYGVSIALTTAVERAFVAEIAPPECKGTLLGLHSMLVGLALLPASMLAGLLWDLFGPPAPFILGGTLALLSAAGLQFVLHPGKIVSCGSAGEPGGG